jgi:voltage-dependent calcium channel
METTTEDPLRFDMSTAAELRTSTPQRKDAGLAGPTGWAAHEDPFFSPTEEDEDDSPTFPHTYTYQSSGAGGGTYATAQPGPSSTSLISSAYRAAESSNGHQDDEDELALTANMSRPGTSESWDAADPERSASTTRSKRTVRYSISPSPLRRAGNRLTTFSRTLRRASLRVVNMAGIGVDEHVRLADMDDEKQSPKEEDEDEDEEKDYDAAVLEISRSLPIRGRTLGFMGPTSKLRLAMFRFLIHP